MIPEGVESIEKDSFEDCSTISLIVSPDSYAEEYCIHNKVTYSYPDSDDWLK